MAAAASESAGKEAARDKVGRSIEADRATLEADIAQLKKDLGDLARQFGAAGEHGMGAARRAAREGVGQLRAQSEATLDNLRSGAKDIEDQVVEHVREKPITSLAIAAGVGFLFALISSR